MVLTVRIDGVDYREGGRKVNDSTQQGNAKDNTRELVPVPDIQAEPVSSEGSRGLSFKGAKLEELTNNLRQAIFRRDTPIEEEVEVIYFNGEPVASLSNFSLALGHRKAGKSSFLSLLLGDRSVVVNMDLPEGKHVAILADTEQSGKYLRNMQYRIEQLHGSWPDGIVFLQLREYSPQHRFEIIQLCIETEPNAGLLIIDNLKDICPDFNDPAEADRVIGTLIRWAQVYNIHVMAALHLNKGNGMSRGHLGTEGENKAETIFHIRKDGDRVIIEPMATRGKPFDPFSFRFREDGSLAIDDPGCTKLIATKVKPKRNPTDFEVSFHEGLLVDIFENVESYGYTEMWRTIKMVAQKYSVEIGDNLAKDWLSHYKKEGMVVQVGKRYVLPKAV